MDHSKMHLFIAIPISETIKQHLSTWCTEISKQVSFKKWVFPADYHITVKFLGGVNTEKVLKLVPLIKHITSKMSSFSLSLEGLDTFGKPNSPRILWTGVKGELNLLHTLQMNIETSLESIGFLTENRAYTPHVTLAKTYTDKVRFEAQRLEQIANQLALPLNWKVNELVLYQTHLGREPMYEQVESFSLDQYVMHS